MQTADENVISVKPIPENECVITHKVIIDGKNNFL